MARNKMFMRREFSEIKECYKNIALIISFVALALVIFASFGPLYSSNGFGLSYAQLERSMTEKRLVLYLVQYGTLLLALATFVLSLLFKNTSRLSIFLLVFGGIVLLGQVFLYLYLTKGGIQLSGASLGLGAFATMLAGLLIIGNEFYKLGWQGYNVIVDEEVSAEEQARIDELNKASMEAIEKLEKKETEEVEVAEEVEQRAESAEETNNTAEEQPEEQPKDKVEE